MAELRKITRSNPLSSFQQVAPASGMGFKALAEAMDVAYKTFAPAALDQVEREGEEHGRELARQTIGQGKLFSTSLNYREAIASIESGGNYGAVGPETASGDRAYGKYQVMGSNIGPWTEKHLGRRLSFGEFLADPEAQDRVFDGEFGSYVNRYGNAADAASVWFTGQPASRGAGRSDILGTTGAQYVERFNAALSTRSEVMVRTPEGKVEPRLYSPLSGPILQAHNAAAQVAYQSEILNKSSIDLVEMANAFPLNPEGYSQAATEYIDRVVEDAPQQFKPELRSALENETRRSFLGLVEARHTDIRKRANNESAALVDRWSTLYAEALASGNPDEISVAEQNLRGVLAARQSLPGVAWGPEQSENAMFDASRRAERLRNAQATEALKEVNATLDRVVKSAEAGLRDADEALAFSPEILALTPDRALDARAAVSFRDSIPEFNQMPAADREAHLARVRDQEVRDERFLRYVAASEWAEAAINKRWDEQPMDTAFEVMTNNPPPQIVPPSPDTADQSVASMQARRRYVNEVIVPEQGVDPAYLTTGEREAIGTALSIGQEPEVRAAMAASIVAGFGEDAVRVFSEIGDTDPVLKMAGQLMARGGNPAVAAEMLRGQALLEQNLVQIPQKGTRVTSLNGDVATAFAGVPGAEQIQGQVMKGAAAIYAARAQGVDPSSEAAQDIWAGAVQSTLGQTQAGNKLRGGVQSVWNQPVLLPPKIAGEDVQRALFNAFSLSGDGLAERVGAVLTGEAPANEAWATAGNGVPYLYGEPLSRTMFQNGSIRLVPHKGNIYRMETSTGDPVVDWESTVYFFDIGKLVDATR